MDLEKIQNNVGTELTGAVSSGVENQELYLRNLRESMAPNTFAVYGKQWRSFSAWCAGVGRSSLPASSGTVAEYLDHLRETGHSFSTLQQVAAAIAREHRAMGMRSPTESEEVKVALSAAARSLGRTPKKKAALTLDLLSDILKVIPANGLRNMRDRALLAVGFMGGFRRSELVTLRASDLERKKDNGGRPVIVISLRHSKTDQESKGTVKCLFSGRVVNAVKELENWITCAGLSGDAWLFPRIRRGDKVQDSAMTGQSVALVVKERAKNAGLDLDLSGHSLRRGFITSAIRAGASERSIMNQTGHRSAQTLRGYIERQNVVEFVSFDELITWSDIVSIHAPLTEETYHIFNGEAFRKMKNTAMIINTARGALIDQDALIWALQTGEITYAGLDTFEQEPLPADSPLTRMDNVILNPHSGFYGQDSKRRQIETICSLVPDTLTKSVLPLRNVVNKAVLTSDISLTLV